MRTMQVSDEEFDIIVKGLNNLEGHTERMLDGIKDAGSKANYERALEVIQWLNNDPYTRFDWQEDDI